MTREAAAAHAPRVRTARRHPDGLKLVAERSARRAVLAGGAALLNVRLALADAGVEPVVIPVPRTGRTRWCGWSQVRR